MPSIMDWANLSCILRFIAPQYDNDQWNEIDQEVKTLISPVHFGLANNVLTPQDAALQFSEKLYNLLKTKPEFTQSRAEKPDYIRNTPKTLSEAKQLKNYYRRKVKSSE